MYMCTYIYDRAYELHPPNDAHQNSTLNTVTNQCFKDSVVIEICDGIFFGTATYVCDEHACIVVKSGHYYVHTHAHTYTHTVGQNARVHQVLEALGRHQLPSCWNQPGEDHQREGKYTQQHNCLELLAVQ